MAIGFAKLEEILKQQGRTYYSLRKDKIVGTETIKKLQTKVPKKYIDTRTINSLCEYLDCQPGDIMEYIPTKTSIPTATTHKPAAAKVSHTVPANQKPYYKPFTNKEAKQIDLPELIINVRYQLEIGETFGMEVLSELLEQARQQDEDLKKNLL